MTLTDWLTGVGTVVMALATGALVLMAWSAWTTAQATLSQMRMDSAAAARPYVSARVVPGIGAPDSYDIVLQNHGRSTARGVRLDIRTPLPQDSVDSLASSLQTRFAETFDLVPGEQLRFVWAADLEALQKQGIRIQIGPNDAPKDRAHLGAEKHTDVALTYTNETGTTYESTATLRWDLLGATAISQPGVKLNAGGPTQSNFYKLGQELVAAVNHLRRGME